MLIIIKITEIPPFRDTLHPKIAYDDKLYIYNESIKCTISDVIINKVLHVEKCL